MNMRTQKYKIGLDLGITSVGYAALATDNLGDECLCILEAGARIFDLAEDSKSGKSLALPRREARSTRRRLRRRAHRMQRIKSLLLRYGILSKEELDACYSRKHHHLRDIYEIRLEALDQPLNREDFARLLIHLAQRRGYKSNRKVDASSTTDEQDKKALSAISANEHRIAENQWRSVGEMLMRDPFFAQGKRNTGGSYVTTVTRALMLQELTTIFEAQRRLGNPDAHEELQEAYTSIYAAQRNFDDGPGEESPYGGNMIEKMVGSCTLYPAEKRAACATESFELFSLWSKLNTIKILSPQSSRFLTLDERQSIAELFRTLKSGVTYKQIRKKLRLSNDERFNALCYRDATLAKTEQTTLPYMKAYHQVKSSYDAALGQGSYDALEIAKKDEIGRILTYYKNDTRIREELLQSEHLFTEEEIAAILSMKSFNKFGHLSLLAMRAITPHLQQGLKYHEACAAAGIDFQAKKDSQQLRKLPPLPEDQQEINNPVVLRAIHQCIRVINALTKKYGPPVSVHIEVAREVGKNLQERQQIEKDQEKGRKANEKSKKKLIEDFGIPNPRGGDVLKLRLWEEQNGRCLYTGQPIPYERLLEQGYCETDHIIPYSISLDDSYNNKVLVLTASNRDKNNRLPLQLVSNPHEYSVLVENTIKNFDKKRRLLKESVTEEEMQEMKERNLNDTKYISRYMMNYINDHLHFDPSVDKKKRVIAVNGRITSRLRGLWGITKIREEGDLHHARDAVVIACIGDGLIHRVTEYEKRKKSYQSAQAKEHFPDPWPYFRHEMQCRFDNDPRERLDALQLPQYDDVDLDTIRPIFISRREVRKTTGPLHKETIQGAKRTLTIPKLIDLSKISYDIGTHQITGYCPRTNPSGLLEILLERLADAKDQLSEKEQKQPDAKKAKIIIKKAFTEKIFTLNAQGISEQISKVSIMSEEEDLVLKKVSLCDLNYDPRTHNIADYYNPDSDILLYHLLCDHLKACYQQALKETILAQGLETTDLKDLKSADILLHELKLDAENDHITGGDLENISDSVQGKLLANLRQWDRAQDFSSYTDNKNFKKKLKLVQADYFNKHTITKPTPRGGTAPVVRKVKIYKKVTTGVELNDGKGVADNGRMARIDVYHVPNDGYYFVPVYMMDIARKVVPDLAPIAYKPQREWKKMKAEDFLFSLSPNSLVKITQKKPIVMEQIHGSDKKKKTTLSESEYLYYRAANTATVSIRCVSHDNSYEVNSMGLKSLVSIEKYYVDDLGNRHKIPPHNQQE